MPCPVGFGAEGGRLGRLRLVPRGHARVGPLALDRWELVDQARTAAAFAAFALLVPLSPRVRTSPPTP